MAFFDAAKRNPPEYAVVTRLDMDFPLSTYENGLGQILSGHQL
jgi:hypothetical protein